jgi:glycosyltransferase involved in cell wall biosynthesis
MAEMNTTEEIDFGLDIPSEEKILAGWTLREPKVSIVCITFNQKQYIEKALRSFLMQKTEFPFEIVIHDDASTDGTESIVRQYANRYPNLIKPLYETWNQYSQGVKITTALCIPRCSASLIALCEGDDYWISPNKLQLQYEAMNRYPSARLCFHQVRDVSNDETPLGIASDFGEGEKLYQGKAIVESILVRTSSIMVGKEIFEQVAVFNTLCPESPVSDYPIKTIAADRGGAIYIPSTLSSYRRNVTGSWTQKRLEDFHFYVDTNLKMIAMFATLDRIFEGRYGDSLIQKQSDVLVTLLRSEKVPVDQKISLYLSHGQLLSFKERMLFHSIYRHRFLSQESRKTILFLRRVFKREQGMGNV